VLRLAIALSVEEEVLSAFGESLGDHLGVESVGKDFGPVLEESIGGDAGRASVLVAFRDGAS